MTNIIDYPDNPTIGKEVTIGATVKRWDGEKWVNKSFGNHEKRLQKDRQAIEAAYKAQGYNNVFFFEDGFTYTEPNDIGVYSDGTAWQYDGVSELPIAVSAGTVPSVGAGYEQVTFNASSTLVFENIADMQTGDLADGGKALITNKSICETLGFLAKGDGGRGIYTATGTVDVGNSGNVDIIGGYIYAGNGVQLKVTPVNGRVTSASMGIVPDGLTDYHADGRMDKWLRYLSATDVTGVFIAGIYNTTMDNYYSNVSIHGEKGAIFTSGFHVAVNRDLNNSTLDRTKNTTWTGECASYERVGTWNCDNTYIERIIIREDASKSKSGVRGAGVHLFGGTEDMTVGSIYVENSERSAALAVDWEPEQTPPKNVHLGNVVIKSSYVHGVSLVGENITWDTMVVEEYGMGELTDPNINFAVSQNPGGLVQAMGFSLGSFGSYSGNSVIVEQNPSSPQGVGSAVNLFTNGTFECGLVKVSGSLGIGFQNNFTDATIDKLVIENSSTQGVFNKAKISGSSLVVSGSGTRGIRNEQGGLLAFNEVRTSGNGEEGYDSGDGIVAINRMQCLNNNQSTVGFGCVIGTQSKGNISELDIEQPSSGIGGGVEFNGILNKFTVGNIRAKNASSSAGTGFASISLKANGLTHYGGGELSGDNGASSFQPLRIVGALNLSLNGLNISNEFNGQIVAGTISATDNIGFMNCVNAAGTNISSVTVSEFNCVGMTA